MNDISSIFLAAISIISVVIGYTLQFIFNIISLKSKSWEELKVDTYKDYIKGVSDLKFSLNTTTQVEKLAKFTDAKTRICLVPLK